MVMTQSNEIAEELRFVRAAVENRDRVRPAAYGHLIVWAMYSLICVPMYDFLPQPRAAAINLAGFLLAMVVSGILGRRESKRSGQYDRAEINRTLLHWFGGIGLLLLATIGMQFVDP